MSEPRYQGFQRRRGSGVEFQAMPGTEADTWGDAYTRTMRLGELAGGRDPGVWEYEIRRIDDDAPVKPGRYTTREMRPAGRP